MKNKRQASILEIIKSQIILTQEDLQTALLNSGYNVTQSTVSRDIKELKLIKGHDASGNYRYLSTETQTESTQSIDQYHEMFLRSVKSVEYSLNIVVVKCYNGMASGACVAIDTLFGDWMLGTLAGDDTILIVTNGEKMSEDLTAELRKLI